MRFVIIILLTAVIGVSGYFAYKKYQNPNTVTVEKTNEINVYHSDKTEFDLEIAKIQSTSKQPTNISNLKYYGWIPDWDMPNGLETLKQNPQIGSVSPFWFDLNSDGSLKENYYTNWTELIDYTSRNNIDLVPTITSFDKDKLTSVLNSAENTNRFIEDTMWNVEQYNYNGIDLDFELFYTNDQKLFIDLMSNLKQRLNSLGKKLYISALPKWGNNVSYGQSKSTLNYKMIAPVVDVFIIQGYSYTSLSTNSIGPTGPIKWLEDVIRYAINEGVPREKLVLGIHTYALDWSERNIQYDLLYYTPQGLNDVDFSAEPAVAYYYNGVDKLLSNYAVDQQFINDWGEMLGSYDYNGQKRYVVYPNSDSITLRKQLAADYGINGISYWKLGSEGSLKL